jgi:hypothetical protein
MIDYNILALQCLVNNCKFTWTGTEWDGLDWQDARPKPTRTEWETEKAKLIAYQPKQNCKDEAKRKIQACDWSVLEDVNLINKQAFIEYRSYLRNLILNPVEDPIWQPEPDPIWN